MIAVGYGLEIRAAILVYRPPLVCSTIVFYTGTCGNVAHIIVYYRSSLQWHLQLEDWIKTNVVDLLCFIIITLATLAVTMLLCYHTYLMLTGQTTWEQASRQRILYLKNLEMFTNPFDEGCYDNVSTFLCGCQQIGRNWETVYNKRVYR